MNWLTTDNHLLAFVGRVLHILTRDLANYYQTPKEGVIAKTVQSQGFSGIFPNYYLTIAKKWRERK